MSHVHDEVIELPARLEGESVEVCQEASASRRRREKHRAQFLPVLRRLFEQSCEPES